MANNGKRPPMKKGTLKRLLKTLLEFYPVLLPVTLLCILFSAVVAAAPSIFMQKVIAVIEESWQSGNWSAVSGRIFGLVAILIVLYILSLASVFTWNRLMAIITQGTLKKLRCKMFSGMQNLPLRYFDTHSHGDIMSHYTNDIDTLRQLVSQSLPQLMSTAIVVTSVLCIMLYFSLWLALVVVAGTLLMLLIVKYVGGNSAKYFRRQQIAVGRM